MYRKYMTDAQFYKLKQEQQKYRYMDMRTVGEVFPEVDKIEITYHLHHISAFGKQDKEETRAITPQSQAVFVFDCLNRECSSAGFDLKNEIYAMRRDNLNEKSGEMSCEGQEAPDHPEQSCGGTLQYMVRITYRK